jgi:hypothetical protein
MNKREQPDSEPWVVNGRIVRTGTLPNGTKTFSPNDLIIADIFGCAKTPDDIAAKFHDAMKTYGGSSRNSDYLAGVRGALGWASGQISDNPLEQ